MQTNIQMVFPDGFKISYTEMWNLGMPDTAKHWDLCEELQQLHGGAPKAYLEDTQCTKS